MENEDEWKWITSDVEFDYTNWGKHEPNQDVVNLEEDCLDLKAGIAGWNDERCSLAQRYICEQSEIPEYDGFNIVKICLCLFASIHPRFKSIRLVN